MVMGDVIFKAATDFLTGASVELFSCAEMNPAYRHRRRL
jgi:hypothetical protein